ncbi:MAG TPA: ligase-associated DNA damage response endonuclease PdeM [Burkholderiaceae bacterium]|nr:ligase-associated DNA damage response endonuclease PdeM [Burkholderiaceae bacterium]
MNGAAATNWAGEDLQLLPDRAVWWPRGRTLFIADAHFGKGDALRAAAQPVPTGTTGSDLQRLDALIGACSPARIVFLGDFLHARQARSRAVLDALRRWRAQHEAIDMELVRGNHDRHAGDLPGELAIRPHDEPQRVGPFVCRHHPGPSPDGFVLAGHLHPVCSLRGAAHDSLRLPCFAADDDQAILPAFGGLTGGARIRGRPGLTIHAIAAGHVVRLPGGKIDR